jgi:hypothetical protein
VFFTSVWVLPCRKWGKDSLTQKLGIDPLSMLSGLQASFYLCVIRWQFLLQKSSVWPRINLSFPSFICSNSCTVILSQCGHTAGISLKKRQEIPRCSLKTYSLFGLLKLEVVLAWRKFGPVWKLPNRGHRLRSWE